MQERVDDGSLSFLRIPPDKNSKSFQCPQTTQSNLVNTSFWVQAFFEDVQTKYSRQKGEKGQTLVKITPERDSPESEARKFFTGSKEILYILKKIEELNAFPRKVTLKSNGKQFYFE